MSNDGQRARNTRLKVDLFALLIVALIFIQHLLLGGFYGGLGLRFAVAQLVVFAGLVAVTRGALPPRLPLAGPAVLLGLVFALGLFSLLPVGPPLAHPLWSYVPGAPASISVDPAATRVELVRLAGLTAMFLIGASLGFDRDRADRFILYLTLAGILYSGWAFLASVLDPTEIFGVVRTTGRDRLAASFLNSNLAGTLFASLAAMSLIGLLKPLMRSGRSGGRRKLDEVIALWPQALLFLLAMTCLLRTASRGGLLSFAAATLVGIGYLIWIKGSQRSLSAGFLAVICLLLCVGATVFLVGGDHTATRLGQIDPHNNDRLQIFAALWPTFKASPWLGYGLGAYSTVNFASMTAQNALLLTILTTAHNVYLQWLLQMGIPGALAMTGCVALVLVATARGVARRSSQQTLGASCLVVCTVFAVHGLTDYALEVESMSAFFSVMLGLGYGVAQRPSRAR